jgi:hypothetical protein
VTRSGRRVDGAQYREGGEGAGVGVQDVRRRADRTDREYPARGAAEAARAREPTVISA